jgi:serralysin
MPTDTDGSTPTVFSTPKGGLFGGPFDSSGLDADVRAVLMDFRWTTSFGGPTAASTISYSFPTQASDYTVVPGYPSAGEIASFQPVTDEQKAAVRTAFDLVASYTNLTFLEVASGLATDSAFRFARFNQSGSESRFPANQGPYAPTDSRDTGDTFLGGNGDPPAAFFGTDDFNTIIHEMGHAFGLKHGHDDSYNGALAPGFNDNEFSVMTYASYLGSPSGAVTVARDGSSPQSYMMFDIAALQAYYGANFSKVGTTAVYRWDPATGQQFINGSPAPSTGTTATNKIFSTVWTQGAHATYDLSAFSNNQIDDLRPGHWLTFSHAQLADLNSNAAPGTPQYQAQGNIYNALLHDGDTRSLVSNLISGSGNDTIVGNDIDNVLMANAGKDIIYGLAGNDTISGGAGADTIDPGTGHDILRDGLGDLNGDMIFNFGLATTVDISGSLIGRDHLAVTIFADTTTLNAVDTYIGLNGAFIDGDFMAVGRHAGDGVHTMVTFVPFLPALFELVSVDPDKINGIANEPFLTGDGVTQFTLDFKAAASMHSNTLGFYRVATDGTIFGVDIVFDNTLNVSPAQWTVSLGTPANGERLGFFLIQDGFDRYGGLPDNLSFVASSMAPAHLEGGEPVFLQSATLGLLTDAPIFHSFQALNPENAIQVLSGVAPGGRELLVGFEDLPNGTGDNDFQDVVIGIRINTDDYLVL